MKVRLALLCAAALTMGGCNMFGPAPSNDRAEARDRDKDRDRDRDREKNRSSEERDADRGRDEDRGGTERASLDDEPRGAGPADEITEAWLIGSWADNPDCTQPIEFRENGRFTTHDGGSGRWEVRNGDTVVFTGSGGRNELRLRRVNANQVAVVDGSGGSWRCD